jgi:HEAT repeat protein
MVVLLGSCCLVLAGESSTGGEDSGVVIAPSAAFAKSLPLDETRVREACKVLSANATERERQAALAALSKDKTKAVELLAPFFTDEDAALRLGAVRVFDDLKAPNQNCSLALGALAVGDGSEQVRKAAIAATKSRRDDLAVRAMIGRFVGAFDAAGNVRDKNFAATATASLRDLNDKRVYQALLYMVLMEVRATNVSLGNLTTRQIDTYNVMNGAQANAIVPLALPIQMPELNVAAVRTSVMAPAVNALRMLSGQDFGENWEKWDKWVAKQR